LKSKAYNFRTIVKIIGSDEIMNNKLFSGTYLGLTKSMFDFEIETINNFVAKYL